MASRRLQIRLIVLVIGVVLVLVEADRNRRDDSSGGSVSSSGQPSRRRTRLPNSNRPTQNGNRNGNPNGARRTRPGATNQRSEGRSRPGQNQESRNNGRQNPTKEQGPKGGNRVSGSIQQTHSNSPPPSQRQPTQRGNLPMKNRNNSVEGKKQRTHAKPNVSTNRQTPRRKTNRRSSGSLSSSCCSSRGSDGSEPIWSIAPPTKSPIVGVLPTRSDEASRETSRNEAGGTDISKEEDPVEDETKEDEMGEDENGKDEDKADDVTTVEGSGDYTIPTEIATFTIVTDFKTLNNTSTETTTPSNRDVSPPLPVRRKRSIVFCEADRPRSVSKCPCPEKFTLPVLPQFPMTECKFRKVNDIAIPIGIKTNGRNTSSRSSATYLTATVASLIVSFNV